MGYARVLLYKTNVIQKKKNFVSKQLNILLSGRRLQKNLRLPYCFILF